MKEDVLKTNPSKVFTLGVSYYYIVLNDVINQPTIFPVTNHVHYNDVRRRRFFLEYLFQLNEIVDLHESNQSFTINFVDHLVHVLKATEPDSCEVERWKEEGCEDGDNDDECREHGSSFRNESCVHCAKGSARGQVWVRDLELERESLQYGRALPQPSPKVFQATWTSVSFRNKC